MQFYLDAIILGLCLGSMAMGIFITMKIFNIPDITTDGSYTLGATVTAILITSHWPVFAVLPVSIAAGALAGVCTGLIHTKLKIDALLSGILVMTGLYSVNLAVLGRSNVPLVNVKTIFTSITILHNETYNQFLIGIILIVLLALLITWMLKTDFGIAMRATGNSPTMTRAIGVNTDRMKIIGFAIANSCTALSGFLAAQYNGFTDINMGIGIVITGLGSVLIADALRLWFNINSISKQVVLVIIGSIIFQFILATALQLDINPNMLKLITALFVLLIVALPRIGKLKGLHVP